MDAESFREKFGVEFCATVMERPQGVLDPDELDSIASMVQAALPDMGDGGLAPLANAEGEQCIHALRCKAQEMRSIASGNHGVVTVFTALADAALDRARGLTGKHGTTRHIRVQSVISKCREQVDRLSEVAWSLVSLMDTHYATKDSYYRANIDDNMADELSSLEVARGTLQQKLRDAQQKLQRLAKLKPFDIASMSEAEFHEQVAR